MKWLHGVAIALVLTFMSLGGTGQAQESSLPAPNPNIQKPNAGTIDPPALIVQTPARTAPAIGPVDDTYHLGAGDKMKVTVYGEPDLSGDFLVNATGRVQFPLIGEIQAADLTVQEFGRSLSAELGAKYLRNPKVSIEIENYRPFYIIGEVNKPGEYPYESGLSLHGAVALAGGYTYRAKDSSVYIRRLGSGTETSMPVTGDIKIYPGDVVRIPERIF
jgi:protein involved in polysaccharide export with SLBB domain